MQIATLNQILSTRSRATFSRQINLSNGSGMPVDKINEWCTINCTGYWRHNYNHATFWQFAEENDAVLFTLKWG